MKIRPAIFDHQLNEMVMKAAPKWKNEVTIDFNCIHIKAKWNDRNNVRIESHQYLMKNETVYKIEYRIHSNNGYDSWNSDRKYFSLVEAIKKAEKLVKEWDSEYPNK